LSRKRRTIPKLNHESISNENIKQEVSSSDILIDQIDDELLQRLSQGKENKLKRIQSKCSIFLDFVYIDKRTGIRWIGTKARPKPMSTLVSRFSWKPKINHYEKYSDIIRTSIDFNFEFSFNLNILFRS
jgi:hypothetical protein